MCCVPARYVMWIERELSAEFYNDSKGQRGPKDHVGECEVEDEDVPGSPHLLLPHYRAQ